MRDLIYLLCIVGFFSLGLVQGERLERLHQKINEIPDIFEAGDCLSFLGTYEYLEPTFPEKYIVSAVDKEVYEVYDFRDVNLSNRKFLRKSTAAEFRKVQCNESK